MPKKQMKVKILLGPVTSKLEEACCDWMAEAAQTGNGGVSQVVRFNSTGAHLYAQRTRRPYALDWIKLKYCPNCGAKVVYVEEKYE